MSLIIELKISDNDTHIKAEIEVPLETNQATLVRKSGEICFQRDFYLRLNMRVIITYF